jgi:hypothetical protein
VGTVNADGDFKPLQEEIPSVSFNLCTNDEHVPEIERYIRTVKDRMRSGYNSLPFEWVPRMMVIRLAANSVFWLNAFPHPDGVSESLSPQFLITGQRLDYKKHVRLEFGAYVQTHEEHTNGMEARTVGAICLGPTGNEQGGHYFMSLGTGRRLTRNRWTELPMPNDAIACVNELGQQQGMPKTLNFADRYGHEIPDDDDDGVDDDHDSAYDPADGDSVSTDSSASYDSDDDDDSNAQPQPPLTAGVNDGGDDEDSDDDSSAGSNDDSDDSSVDHSIPGLAPDSDTDSDSEDDNDSDDGIAKRQTIDIKDEVLSSPQRQGKTGVGSHGETAGVCADAKTAGVCADHRPMGRSWPPVQTVPEEEDDGSNDGADPGGADPDDDGADPRKAEGVTDGMTTEEMNERYGAHTREGLRPRKPRSYDHRYKIEDSMATFDASNLLATFEHPLGEVFVTKQMFYRKGLKVFGKRGAEAVVSEL